MNRFSLLVRTAVAVLTVAGVAACDGGSRAGTVGSASLTATCDPLGTSSLDGFTTSAKRAVFTWVTGGAPVTFEFGQVGSATLLETPTAAGAQSLSAVVFDKAGRRLGAVTVNCLSPVIEPPLPTPTEVLITVEDQSKLNPTTLP